MKKFFALLLTLAMVLSLAACGGNTEEETPADDGAQTEEPAEGGETADLSEALVEPGKLIMSTNAAFPPYEMVADGEGVYGTGFEGIDIEIAWPSPTSWAWSWSSTTWTSTPPCWRCRTTPPT